LEAIGEFLRRSPRRRRQSCEDRGERLGLCSPGNPAQAANTTAMAAIMAEFMPGNMRESGFAMHEAASHLAGEAAKLQQSSELKPALGLLHSHAKMRGLPCL
jgi:hypothetical protein